MVRRPSVVRPQCSNIFFSETAWPIKAKFYVEPPWVGGTIFCSRHLGHMTKMAAMPIYGQNPSKIFFSRTGGPISTKLGTLHWGLQPIIVCSNDDPGVTLTYFTARSNLVTGFSKSNQINFIGIKSSHRTVTSHMYTITQLHVQLQSQIDPYTNVFLYIYIYIG